MRWSWKAEGAHLIERDKGGANNEMRSGYRRIIRTRGTGNAYQKPPAHRSARRGHIRSTKKKAPTSILRKNPSRKRSGKSKTRARASESSGSRTAPEIRRGRRPYPASRSGIEKKTTTDLRGDVNGLRTEKSREQARLPRNAEKSKAERYHLSEGGTERPVHLTIHRRKKKAGNALIQAMGFRRKEK